MNRHSSAPAPIRHQYLRIKQHYPDAILLFRLGDFYETFEEDARIASRELGITLTSREMGKGQHFPMAGIPHHALDNYLGKLIGRGYKVAICEQISDPTASRGLVDRDVVRVVTPGTVVEPQLLEQKANNYLAALVLDEKGAGLAYVDITTSEFSTTQLAQGQVQAEMERLRPSEVLVPKDVRFPETWLTGTRTFLDKSWFEPESARQLLLEHFGASTLEGFGCEGLPLATAAAGAIVHYLQETQKGALGQLTRLSTYSTQAFMTLDPQTRRNLELFQSSSLVSPANSLLSVLDITRTPMGGRLLRKWLGQPLLDLQELGKRQEAVEWFYKRAIPRTGVLSALSRIPDLERLVNRIKGRIAIHKEVLALRRGLEMLPELEGMLKEKGEADSPDISWLTREVKPCNDIVALISKAIADEAPASIGEGAVIKAGFSEELDSLKAASRNAAEYIAGLERKERESTGIKSLKVGYNKVFGYYIEVSKPNLSQVPKEYIRKQTLVNGERFFTPELKEYESLILNARERIEELETALFRQVCFQIETSAERILTTASALAHIDAFSALAEVASRHSYVRPTLTRDDTISIIGGRHPVVEKALPQGEFAPNDTHLSNKDTQIVILTGPNMSGKSTYLRQVALIVLMAQIGSFVPAE
ncbi:MAG: DNA mismatch repair protein MutS, partial [Chloroflexi bacterium]|nr:DNA mismatch repair protein MutS [Chloroflexota bacterium]